MKLVVATAALPFLAQAFDYAQIIEDYCDSDGRTDQTEEWIAQWGPQLTDVQACRDYLNADIVKDRVSLCLSDNENGSDKSNCMQAVMNDADTADDYSTEQYAMEEFLEGIGDDPMLKNVLAEMNSLEAYLESNSLTKSLGNGTASDTEQQEGTLAGMKRFVELKQLVSWLQPRDKRISRYCFYGCWCLPEGAHSFVAGEGRPVDLVDKACQYLWFCYTCAKQEFRGVFLGKTKECTPDKQKYTFRFRYDKAHPAHYDKRDIVCKDTFYNPMNTKDKWKSNCARAICECDRGLAKRLWRAWTHWDKSRHRIWSQKVVSCKQLTDCGLLAPGPEKDACVRRGCLFIVKRRCLNGVTPGFSPDHAEICCGLYQDEGGRMEMRDHGGTHSCCNHDQGAGSGDKFPWSGNWYNTITHCCSDGKVYSAAHPSC